ncbi:MAG: phage protein Gp36 family protein [Brevinema sp.]
MDVLYCTMKDITDAVRFDAITSWAKDDSRENDALALSRIEQAIARATDEINLYIGKVTRLPLQTVPTSLRDCCVKMAIYKVASRKGVLKEGADLTLRQNYEDALHLLDRIASGKVGLGLTSDQQSISSAKEDIASFFPPSRMGGTL